MGVDTLQKSSSSSKLAGQLQGIIKSEPVEVAAKVESFGRAMDSARRIVDGSESPKSLKNKAKKAPSDGDDAKGAESKQAAVKHVQGDKEAKAEPNSKAKKSRSKASLTKADSAAFESKAVAQEPTEAHNVAESVKGTLERLAAQSLSPEGDKEASDVKKSQKSTTPKIASPDKLSSLQGSAKAEERHATAKAEDGRVAAEASETMSTSSDVDVEMMKETVADKASALTKGSPKAENGALLDSKRTPALKTQKMVESEQLKVEDKSEEGGSVSPELTGPVNPNSAKDAKKTVDSAVATEKSIEAMAEPGKTTEQDTAKVQVAELPLGDSVVSDDDQANDSLPLSASVSETQVVASPVQVAMNVATNEKASAVAQKPIAVKTGNDKNTVQTALKGHHGHSEQLDAVKVTDSDAVKARSLTDAKSDAATESKAGISVQSKNEKVPGKVERTQTVSKSQAGANPVKVPDAQMEARASDHLYRAVNKLSKGAGAGIIARSKNRAKVPPNNDAKAAETSGKRTEQNTEGAVKVASPMAEKAGERITVDSDVSKTQMNRRPASVLGELKMKQANLNAEISSKQTKQKAQDKVPSVETKKVAQDTAKIKSAESEPKVAPKENQQTRLSSRAPVAESLNLGARDSMRLESSLIGKRLLAKRGPASQSGTYRNMKPTLAQGMAREDFTAAKRVRASRQDSVAKAAVKAAPQTVATDTAVMAATSGRTEAATPDMAPAKRASAAPATNAAEANLRNESGETTTSKNSDAGQEQRQNKEQSKRIQENRHFESKKQVETEARMKEEALDEMQEASDVEIADEVAQVKQTVAVNRTMAKEGGRAVISPLRDAADTPRNAAAISERREVHEQMLAKNLGRNLGRIASMGTTHAKLRLHPQEFGRVDVEIRTRDGEVTLLVRTETVNAAAELNSQMNDLRASMKEHGLNLAECDVDSRGFGAEDREADGSREGKDGDGRGRGDQDNREGHGNRRRRGRGQRIKRSAIDVVV